MNLADNLDLLSGSIIFNRQRARELVTQLIERQCCSAGGCGENSHLNGNILNGGVFRTSSNTLPRHGESQGTWPLPGRDRE